MIRFLINTITRESLAHLIDCINTIIDYATIAYPDDKYLHDMFLNALDYLISYQTDGKK